MSVLSVKKLLKIYPKSKIASVNGISFDLKEKEILGFLGPNGCGKTTTIQMLLGTLLPTSGEIFYFGENFSTNREDILQYVTFASTYTSLPWLLTISENLKVVGRLYGLSGKESELRFSPLLERFGLLDKKNARVSSLSSGQITRLTVVKAFFIKPKIVLLDEPTASLDPDIAKEVCDFILEQREKTQLSILFTSHKMEEVTELCDRVIFMKEGQIIADDLPQNLTKTNKFHLKLTIADDMKRILAIVEEKKISYKIDHRIIDIEIDEKEIPSFLNSLSKADVNYLNIKIEEPTLDDYFLQMARKIR